MSIHRFILEPYNGTKSRYRCPSCGEDRQFSRYVDSYTGEYVGELVGRCNRENSCGYHYKPTNYKTDGGIIPENKERMLELKQAEPPKLSFVAEDSFFKSFNGFLLSDFAAFIVSLFREQFAKDLLLKYMVGRSRKDDGKACIFWRVDINDKIRTGKVVCYDPISGKRKKDDQSKPYLTHKTGDGFRQCFFGEHLLSVYPNKPVGIVESEKTAIIASVYLPEIVFIATGGASGCKWREAEVYSVLKNRDCVFFPDFGFYNKKTGKTCFQEWSERVDRIRDVLPGSFKVSRVLENNFPEEDRNKDLDLADILLKREGSGLAVTDWDYPLIWDVRPREIAA